MLALYLKEIRGFLNSFIGYIVIGVFLTLAGLLLWVLPNFEYNIFDSKESSLLNFFKIAPYIFLLLIPSITMKSFAEEKRLGTIELLLTKPIRDFNIILAKFLAGVTLVLVAILPTIVYFFCIEDLKTDLSQIDAGQTIGSYIGLSLLTILYVSISLFASSLSNNQVVAFILGLTFCVIMYLGFDSLSQLFTENDTFLMQIGILDHYKTISKGLLDTSDVVYFICTTGIFLTLTYLVVNSRKW